MQNRIQQGGEDSRRQTHRGGPRPDPVVGHRVTGPEGSANAAVAASVRAGVPQRPAAGRRALWLVGRRVAPRVGRR